ERIKKSEIDPSFVSARRRRLRGPRAPDDRAAEAHWPKGTRDARQIRVAGAIHAGYSTITDYPLGVVKVLPFQAHLALDAVGAVALAATPFVTGQFKKGTSQWVPHVA